MREPQNRCGDDCKMTTYFNPDQRLMVTVHTPESVYLPPLIVYTEDLHHNWEFRMRLSEWVDEGHRLHERTLA